MVLNNVVSLPSVTEALMALAFGPGTNEVTVESPFKESRWFEHSLATPSLISAVARAKGKLILLVPTVTYFRDTIRDLKTRLSLQDETTAQLLQLTKFNLEQAGLLLSQHGAMFTPVLFQAGAVQPLSVENAIIACSDLVELIVSEISTGEVTEEKEVSNV